MNANLLHDLRREAVKHAVVELPEPDAARAVDSVKDSFVEKPERLWWWEGLRPGSVSYNYDDQNQNILSVIGDILENEEVIYICATDDEPRPWPVYSGSVKNIVDMIGEIRHFEFFIFDKNASWVLFDTHHNLAVVSGTLVEKAVSIFPCQS